MRATTFWAPLAGLALSLSACASAPPPLPAGTFVDNVARDISIDQDTSPTRGCAAGR